MESYIDKVNPDLDIFIYSHKPFDPPIKNKCFKVLTCCDDEINTELEVYRDYEGENISDLNLLYNEYAGFYWIWKNYPIKEYIGLNHYRRYYEFMGNVPNIAKIFRRKDIILNTQLPLKNPMDGTMMTNRTWYDFWHNVEDFDLLGDIIREKFPEYTDGFDKMSKADHIYPCSMFIMKKDCFYKYCNFIFPLLEEYRNRRGFNTPDDCIKWVEDHRDKYIKPHLKYYTVPMQARIIGYIAERALATFLMNGKESLESKATFFKWVMYEPQGQVENKTSIELKQQKQEQ